MPRRQGTVLFFTPGAARTFKQRLGPPEPHHAIVAPRRQTFNPPEAKPTLHEMTARDSSA